MKKLLLGFVVAVLAMNIAAQTIKKKENQRVVQSSSVDRKSGFTVSGTVEEAVEGDKVFISEMKGCFSLVASDSTLVHNGRYIIKGQQRQPVIRFVVAKHGNSILALVGILLENTDIIVNLHKDSKKNEIKGGRDNDLWREFNARLYADNAKMNPTYRIVKDTSLSTEVRREAQEKIDKWKKEQQQINAEFILAHIPSGVSSLLVSQYYASFDSVTQKRILSAMKTKCPYDEFYQRIIREKEIARHTAIGKMYTDIALSAPTGKIIRLSDFVKQNKLTLLDFWASWCGPCRAEMPNIIKVYNEYKGKGLAVVGVSLDSNKELWTKAVSSLGITWCQMSDLKGWASAGAAAYDVRSIPSSVLISHDGRIIARNLRGDELRKTVAMYLSVHP